MCCYGNVMLVWTANSIIFICNFSTYDVESKVVPHIISHVFLFFFAQIIVTVLLMNALCWRQGTAWCTQPMFTAFSIESDSPINNLFWNIPIFEFIKCLSWLLMINWLYFYHIFCIRSADSHSQTLTHRLPGNWLWGCCSCGQEESTLWLVDEAFYLTVWTSMKCTNSYYDRKLYPYCSPLHTCTQHMLIQAITHVPLPPSPASEHISPSSALHHLSWFIHPLSFFCSLNPIFPLLPWPIIQQLCFPP